MTTMTPTNLVNDTIISFIPFTPDTESTARRPGQELINTVRTVCVLY